MKNYRYGTYPQKGFWEKSRWFFVAALIISSLVWMYWIFAAVAIWASDPMVYGEFQFPTQIIIMPCFSSFVSFLGIVASIVVPIQKNKPDAERERLRREELEKTMSKLERLKKEKQFGQETKDDQKP